MLIKEYKLKKQREDQLKGFTTTVGEKPEEVLKEEPKDLILETSDFAVPMVKSMIVKPPASEPPKNAERPVLALPAETQAPR